jgi:hypothetical protein
VIKPSYEGFNIVGGDINTAKEFLMKRRLNLLVMLACLLALALTFIGCGGKNGGGGKANPASDFSYDLTEDGQGIVIKGYTGGPGKVVIPSKIEDIDVVEIGDKAFDGKSVVLSGSILSGTAQGEIKTNDKAGITSITIPNTVKKIGLGAFSNTAISNIVIPDSVTELGDNTFSGCNQLTEVRLSDNIETLPSSLFSPALKKVNLPKNLKQIATFAFSGCGELTELIIPDTISTVDFVEWEWFGRYTISDKPGYYPIDDDYQKDIFGGCGKLPIKTRQIIQSWGYEGTF